MKRWRKVLLLALFSIFCISPQLFAKTEENVITPKVEWETEIEGALLNTVIGKKNVAFVSKKTISSILGTMVMNTANTNIDTFLELTICDNNTGKVIKTISEGVNSANIDKNYTGKIYPIPDDKEGNTRILFITTTIFCVNIDKSEIIWKYDLETNNGAFPIAQEGNICVFIAPESTILASKGFFASLIGINLETGKMEYKYPKIYINTYFLTYYYHYFPKTNIVTCFMKAKKSFMKSQLILAGISIKDGQIKWETPINCKIKKLSAIWRENDLYLFYPIKKWGIGKKGKSYSLKKINVKDGSAIIEKQLTFNSKILDITVYKNFLLFYGKSIICKNAETLENLWELEEHGSNIFFNDKIFFFHKKQIKAFDLSTGKFLWKTDVPFKLKKTKLKAIINDKIFIASENSLYLINIASGKTSQLMAIDNISDCVYIKEYKEICVLCDNHSSYKLICLSSNDFSLKFKKEYSKKQDGKIATIFYFPVDRFFYIYPKHYYFYVSINLKMTHSTITLTDLSDGYTDKFSFNGSIQGGDVTKDEKGNIVMFWEYSTAKKELNSVLVPTKNYLQKIILPKNSPSN